nr:MAG TPA: hypothetical protein [Caudoviricetes sp.]
MGGFCVFRLPEFQVSSHAVTGKRQKGRRSR